MKSRKKTDNHRRFARLFLWVMAVALLLIAGLNYGIDPLRCLRPRDHDGLDPFRPTACARGRKAHLAGSGDQQVALVGASRTDLGFDPRSPALGGRQACDLGMPMADASEILAAGKWVLARNPHLEWLILELDPAYFAAGYPNTSARRFTPWLSPLSPTEQHGSLFLGGDQTVLSIKTLSKWLRDERTGLVWDDRGMGHLTNVGPYGRIEPTSAWAVPSAGVEFDGKPSPGGWWPMDFADMQQLQDLGKTCRQRGVRLTVLLPPCHPARLWRFQQLGYWPLLDHYKTLLTEQANGLFEVRDCMVCSPETAETPVPGKGLTLYYEAVHFRPELGGMALAAIADKAPAPGQFGHAITPASLQEHLANARQRLEAYLLAHPQADGMLPPDSDPIVTY